MTYDMAYDRKLLLVATLIGRGVSPHEAREVVDSVCKIHRDEIHNLNMVNDGNGGMYAAVRIFEMVLIEAQAQGHLPAHP